MFNISKENIPGMVLKYLSKEIWDSEFTSILTEKLVVER